MHVRIIISDLCYLFYQTTVQRYSIIIHLFYAIDYFIYN